MHDYAGNSTKKKNPSATYLFWMVSDTTLTCVIEVCEDGDLWLSVCSLFVCVWVSFDSLLDSGTALQRWTNIDCGHFHLNKPFLCVTCPLTSARKIINFSSAHTLVIELILVALCHRCSFEYTNSGTQGHSVTGWSEMKILRAWTASSSNTDACPFSVFPIQDASINVLGFILWLWSGFHVTAETCCRDAHYAFIEKVRVMSLCTWDNFYLFKVSYTLW